MSGKISVWTQARAELAKMILGRYPVNHLDEAIAEFAKAAQIPGLTKQSFHNGVARSTGQPPGAWMRTRRTAKTPVAVRTPPAIRVEPPIVKVPTNLPTEELIAKIMRQILEGLNATPASAEDEIPVDTSSFAGGEPVPPDPTPEEAPGDMPGLEERPTAARERMVQRLLKLVKGGPVALEELCDRLDLSPAKTLELAEEARAQGYDVEFENEHVGRRPPPNPLEEAVIRMPAPVSSSHRVALIGDVHIGSKYFMEAAFLDFVGEAYGRGVRVFPCVGDLMDGVYSFSIYEQVQRGFEEQCPRAIEVIPRLEGARWPWILGNHDETFETKSGMSVISAANAMFRAAGRTDVECIGSRGKYLRLQAPGEKRGIRLELWHPGGRSAYALSYKMQNHIRDYPVGRKPDILATGHWHQQCYFENRGVHAFSCGCWQGGGSGFGKSIGGAPSIGSWILEYKLTEAGTLREMTASWRSYYEHEDDVQVQIT